MTKNAAFHLTVTAILTSTWLLDSSHSKTPTPVCSKGGLLYEKDNSAQEKCYMCSGGDQCTCNNGDSQYCKLCSGVNVAPTSVWCHDSVESGLRCHFHNLYYNSRQHGEFVFVHGADSLISGIDNLKVLEKLYLSSVNGHNAFQIRLSVLPWKHVNIINCVVKFEGKTLISGRFKPDNIYHVFHDDLLPTYFTIREFCADMDVCKESLNIIFTDEHEHGVYWDLYLMFTRKVMKLQDLSVDENEWYCFQDTYIGLNKMSVWYQYGFGVLQGPVKNNFQGAYLRQFTNFVREQLGVRMQFEKQSGVLLSRKLNRKIINEKELVDAIQGLLLSVKDYEEITMKTVTLEEGNLKGVISAFSDAALIVGAHGSALILGMFLPPGSVMVELWPYGVDPSAAPVFKTMCELDGFDVIYIPWTNEDFQNTVYHPSYPSHYGGLSHLPKVEQDKVIKGLNTNKLTELECCDSTEWLFRIYQDTTANVGNDSNLKSISVLKLISDGLKRGKVLLSSRAYTDKYLRDGKYPGEVRKLRCNLEREETSTKLYANWIEPWNVKYLECGEIDFEVVMQSKGREEFKKYRTHEGTFLKKLAFNVDKLDIWVTCLCDGFEGSTSYTACL